MRALFLAHTVPYPPVSGERIRNWSLMRELRERGWSLALFALGAEPGDPRRELAALCDDLLLDGLAPGGPARAARILASSATRRAFHETLYVRSRVADRLHSWAPLGRADVLVTSLYTYPYVPPALRPRTVLDPHNAEGRRVASMAAALGLRPRGLAARLQVGPVRRYELEAVAAVARTIAVSETERGVFEPAAPGRVDVVPNGVDPEERLLRRDPPGGRDVLFVGSLDYGANVDAVRRLTGAVAPLLATPGVRLTVVGSNPGRAVRSAARSAPVEVEVAGHVPTVEPYFRRARALAVPLRFGGGTRLKILEALARGVPVVTTTIGCEGLDLEHGRDLLVADEPAEFARCLDLLLGDDELCRRLAAQGFETVSRRYSWAAIGASFDQSLRRAAGAAAEGLSG